MVCRLLWRNLLSSVTPYSLGRWISWSSVCKSAEHDPHCHCITYAIQGNVFFHFASPSKLFISFSSALLMRQCRTVFTFKFAFHWNRGFEFCVPRQSVSSAIWWPLYGSHVRHSQSRCPLTKDVMLTHFVSETVSVDDYTVSATIMSVFLPKVQLLKKKSEYYF
jgi:hypothetical protein